MRKKDTFIDMKNVAILGCGWVGKALATTLLTQGCNVRGSTTCQQNLSVLRNMGIEPFLITIENEGIQGEIRAFLNDIDVLVVAFPPGRRVNPNADYALRITHLIASMKRHASCNVLLLSSIGVFGASQGEVNEGTVPVPETAVGAQLLQAEKAIQAVANSTIVRLGGLVGPNRHPVKQLAGKTELPAPKAPTNLVHQHDVIHFLMALFREAHWGKIFHCVSPKHHERDAFYSEECRIKNLPLPTFSIASSNRNKKVLDTLSAPLFGFKYQFVNCSIREC